MDSGSTLTWTTGFGTSTTTGDFYGTASTYRGEPIYIASSPAPAVWQPEAREPTALEWLDERVDEIAGRGRQLLAA